MKSVRIALMAALALVVARSVPAAEKNAPLDQVVQQVRLRTKGLTLTAEQQAKLDEVCKELGPEFTEAIKKADVLTPGQEKAAAEAWKAALGAGNSVKEAREDELAAAKLTDAQKAQRAEAFQELYSPEVEPGGKVIVVPTAEQKEQVGKAKRAAAAQTAASGRLPKDTKPDVQFVFDFSPLNFHSGDAKQDAALRKRCDSFAKTVRDEVYPMLREITGVYVGKYYKEIRYKIYPSGTMGGSTVNNDIHLDQRYSVDLNPPHDSHELIHVFNSKSGALGGNGVTTELRGSSWAHVWHYALMDAVEARLGLRPEYSRMDALRQIGRIIKTFEASPDGQKSYNNWTLLSYELNLLYFDLGEEAIGRLYRSTINPHPVGKPSARMVAVWGKSADQVQALVESLKRDYKFTFDERSRSALGL